MFIIKFKKSNKNQIKIIYTFIWCKLFFYVIKRLSAIISPTGQEVIAPIQVFNCGSCGELLPLGGEIDELI